MVETRRYIGRVAFESWVLKETVIDEGLELHETPEAAAQEARERSGLVDWGPSLGWVEGVTLKGEPESALRRP